MAVAVRSHLHYLSILGVDDALKQFVQDGLISQTYVLCIQCILGMQQEHFCHVDRVLFTRT